MEKPDKESVAIVKTLSDYLDKKFEQSVQQYGRLVNDSDAKVSGREADSAVIVSLVILLENIAVVHRNGEAHFFYCLILSLLTALKQDQKHFKKSTFADIEQAISMAIVNSENLNGR